MFDSFQSVRDTDSRRRFALSTGASMALYAGIAIAIVALASRPAEKPAREVVRVAFHKPPPAPKPLPKPEPPPAPPPPKKAKTPPRERAIASAANAPPIPRAIPAGELREGSGSDFSAGLGGSIAETRVLGGLGGAAAAPPPPPAPPRRGSGGLSILAADATPPRARAGNDRPPYPEDARREGLEGTVVLRILIDTAGEVDEVEVMSGEEPFLGPAIAAVKSWSYEPAIVEGRPTAVYRVVRVPFRLRG